MKNFFSGCKGFLAFAFIGLLTLCVAACEKSTVTVVDTTPPGKVSNVVVYPYSNSVYITFTEPYDSDYNCTKVTCREISSGKSVSYTCSKGTTEAYFDNLTSDTEYQLEFVSYDTAGNGNEGYVQYVKTIIADSDPEPGDNSDEGNNDPPDSSKPVISIKNTNLTGSGLYLDPFKFMVGDEISFEVTARNEVTWNVSEEYTRLDKETNKLTLIKPSSLVRVYVTDNNNISNIIYIKICPQITSISITGITSQFVLTNSGTKTTTLFASYKDSDGIDYSKTMLFETPVWTSSDEGVATVDEKGEVTAVSAGNAIITLCYGTLTAVYNISVVEKNVPLLTLSFVDTSKELLVGESFTPSIIKDPEDANTPVTFVAYTTNNYKNGVISDVVSIDGNGEITAIKSGTAYIFAKWTYQKFGMTSGYISGTCIEVKVCDPAVSFELDTTAVVLKNNETHTIRITTPANTKYKTKTFTSSNSKIQVSEDGVISTTEPSGVVEGVITVKIDELEPKTVNVKFRIPLTGVTFNKEKVEILIGDAFTPSITKQPEDSNTSVTFVAYATNSNRNGVISDVVSIDENGKITAKKTGTAYIFAMWEEQTNETNVMNISETCIEVKVCNPAVSFELDTTDVVLTYNETHTIRITTPDNTKYKAITFTSSNPKIQVSEEGVISTTETSGLIEGVITVKVDELEPKTMNIAFCVPVTGVKFNKEKVELIVGDVFVPSITTQPENANAPVSFLALTTNSIRDSDISDVVSIDENGEITAIKNGTAYIFALWNEYSDGTKTTYISGRCTELKVYNLVASFELDITDVVLKNNETHTIRITTPANTKYKTITFTSSNPKIQVSEEGVISTTETSGLIEGVITVKVDDLEPKTVNVKFRIPVTGVTFNSELVVLGLNKTADLTATISPSNASMQEITWTSSDSGIATIENGVITAKASGVTTITATADGKSAVATILVLNTTSTFSVTNSADLHVMTESEAGSSAYAGYITDSAGKVAYKYTTANHLTTTGLSAGVGKWDIIGNKGTVASPDWKSSTYNNAGWGYKINNTTVSLSSDGAATNGNLKLQVKPVLVYQEDVPFIMLVHALTNVGSTVLSGQQIGSGTDIQVAGNKTAPVNVTSVGANLVDSNTNMIFTLNCLKGEGVTPVSSMWVGSYSAGAMSKVYTDNRISISNTDSAIAYSWQNIELQPGETKIYTVRLTFVEDKGGSVKAIVY